jgi:outer membrane protein OmpA-like peptidoglycan-associated protein
LDAARAGWSIVLEEEALMPARPMKSLVALALLAAAGCATVPPNDPVVGDAHAAVYAARNNPQVVRYAPTELDQALATMQDADNLAARGGGVGEVHRLAALAQQRAALAQDAAHTRAAEAALTAQRAAQSAQVQAEASREQAQQAQLQAASAQRQAEDAQRHAAALSQQAQSLQLDAGLTPQQLADLAAIPTSRGVVVTLNDAMFDPGRSVLLPGGSATVRKLADFLVTHPERTIAIEGYTDSSGNAYADQRLAEQRAAAVQAALVGYGVEPSRIVVRSYGPAYPIASNGTAAGRQMNRRVEIVISDRSGVVAPRG